MINPKIRFKKADGTDYPEWIEETVADAFDKVKSKNKDGKVDNVITNSAEFGLIPQREFFDKDIAVEGKTGNYTIIQNGDFVYNPRKSKSAPMGPFNCYGYDDEGIVSPLYTCLRPKNTIDSNYLLWYFKTNKWHQFVNDNGAQNGARHDRVGMTDAIMMSIPITAPSEKDEQQKIAEFLNNVDDVIAASEQEVENLEMQKKAVMKKIFSQEVRFKKPDGSDFPEWYESTIGESCIVNPKTEKPSDEFLYIDLGCINDGILSERKVIQKVDAPSRAQRVLETNDVLFQMVRPYNMGHYYFEGDVCQTVASTGFAQLRMKDGVNRFLYQFLFSPEFNRVVNKLCEGSNYPAINTEELSDIYIGIPHKDEQKLIAEFLTSFDEAIAAAKEELEKYKELKKGLLQQMFV